MGKYRDDKSNERLTDQEIASLMGSDLSPEERTALLERLHNDPDAADILALASTVSDDDINRSSGFSDAQISRLLALVHESTDDTYICVHCAHDLVPGEPFCPHCGMQITGKVIKCIKCGKTVREGGSYCPHCGNFFRSTELKRAVIQPIYFLVVGILSIIAAFLASTKSGLMFIVLFSIGMLLTGTWLGLKIVYGDKPIQTAKVQSKSSAQEKSSRDVRKKTG